MNKLFFYAFAASSLLLSACASDNGAENGNEQNEAAVQKITLQVANTGDGLTTRAGRPLNSSEAKQDIQNVKVLVCNPTNEVLYATSVNNWSTTASAYANGMEKQIIIPKDSHLNQGTYTVYAIGYSNNSDYDNLTSITNLEKGGTFTPNTVLTLKGGATDAEEIFAGEQTNFVVNNAGADGSIVLNRQVAGAFGYVKDIPYYEGATKLVLDASAKNTGLVLGAFNSIDFGGNNAGQSVKYVVNGTTASESKNIFTINLSDWFTDITANDNGIIKVTDNWKGDATKYAEGSAFAGKFVIPFAKVDGAQTLTLKLEKADNTVLRSWNVNLAADADQVKAAQDFSIWNENAFATNNAQETIHAYSVVRNHLYGIGKRIKDNPDKPGVDPGDEPESLKKQTLTLRVNDNWEVINNMEVE